MDRMGDISRKRILNLDELEFVFEILMKKEKEKIRQLLIKLNRTGELHDYLVEQDLYEVIEAEKHSKIFILGSSKIPISRIKQIARECGVEQKLDFWLEYSKNRTSVFKKLRKNILYKAVIVGAMPHSTPGTEDYSSFVARMEKEKENYPKVYRARKQNGTLKINESSLRRAFKEIKEDDDNNKKRFNKHNN